VLDAPVLSAQHSAPGTQHYSTARGIWQKAGYNGRVNRYTAHFYRWTAYVLIAGLLLAGCAPTGTATPGAGPDPRGHQLILWYAFDGAPETALLQLIDRFNLQNEWGLVVAAERVRDVNDLRTRLLAAYQHGAMPDLAVADAAIASDLAYAGASVPLDAYLSQPDYGLDQGALADMRYETRQPRFNNQLISWPLGREAVVMVYNQNWLSDIGLSGPPNHWSEFGEIACAVSRDTNGDGAIDRYGYWYDGDVLTLQGWLYSRGSSVLAPDGQSARFGNAEGLAAFRLLHESFAKACALQANTANDVRQAFAGNRALFAFPRTSALPSYEAAVVGERRFPIGVTPLPASGNLTPTVPLGGPDLVLLKTNPDRQLAAWLLMRWLTEPEQSAEWARTTAQFPVRRSAEDDPALLAYLSTHPVLDAAWKLEALAVTEPAVPGWLAVRSILSATLGRVTGGSNDTVERIVSQGVQQADDALANP
jgi:multiple sugar transport system substrate-binding protein